MVIFGNSTTLLICQIQMEEIRFDDGVSYVRHSLLRLFDCRHSAVHTSRRFTLPEEVDSRMAYLVIEYIYNKLKLRSNTKYVVRCAFS